MMRAMKAPPPIRMISFVVLAAFFLTVAGNVGAQLIDGNLACERSCDKNCPNGYLSDSCPRCTCAPDPCQSRNCPPATDCRTIETDCGFATGCPKTAVCEGRISPVCQSTCTKTCEFGFEAVGCPRCTCATDPCLAAACPEGAQCMTKPTSCKFRTFCPHFAMCMTPPCSSMDNNECEFGLLPIGCPRTKCAADPCLSTRCPNGEACRAVATTCSFGIACPYVGICEQTLCAETANKSCSFGFMMRGCPRSQCAPDPCLDKVCPTGELCFVENGICPFTDECPKEAMCRPIAKTCATTLNINCPYGFKPDGCPRTTCSEDPCASNPCSRGEECTAELSQCEFNTGCPYVSRCRPRVCEESLANVRCEYGFQSTGCPRNLCAPNPCQDAICPVGQTCFAKESRCGFQKGCPYVHECFDASVIDCTETVATIPCAFGFLETGCPRATCAPNPCLAANCSAGQLCTSTASQCRTGVQCPHEAVCGPEVCPDVAPNIQCTFGFEPEGCPRVQCAANPCDRITCPVGQTCYAETTDCSMSNHCPYEYVCKPNDCKDVMPNMKCEYGFITEGCPRVKCAPDPCEGNPCPRGQSCFAEGTVCQFGIQCPYERKCVVNDCAETLRLDCTFGIMESGCPRNICAPDPCQSLNCSPDQICRTRPGLCRFGIECPHDAFCTQKDCRDIGQASCRYGVEETGCPRTTCAPNPCQFETCSDVAVHVCTTRPRRCAFGIDCPHEAICSPSVCEDVQDNVLCSFGFLPIGCPRFQCALNPCINATCGSDQRCVATTTNCSFDTHCPYVARCRPKDCKEVISNKKCEFGFLTTGCPRSECSQNPCDGFVCPTGESCFSERGNCSQDIECPFVRKCAKNDCAEAMNVQCRFGVSESGCPRYQCAPDPCSALNCGPARRCITRPSRCTSAKYCPHEATCVANDCAESLPSTCQFGIVERGCPRSVCAPDPCRRRNCPSGQVCTSRPAQCRFRNNCPHEAVCSEEVCSRVADNVRCTFGFLPVGCPRSQCAPNPCQGVRCSRGQLCRAIPESCPLGSDCPYKHECQPNDCADVMANIRCNFGFLTEGCPRSQCSPNPCEGNPCPTGESCFAEPGNCTVNLECPFVRKCQPNNCRDVLPVSCSFGILETGCPRSQCALDPCATRNCGPGRLCTTRPSRCGFQINCPHEAVCSVADCSTVANLSCPFGFLETGCPRSVCAQNPCLRNTCEQGRQCSSRPSQCRSGNNCPHEAVCSIRDCAEVSAVSCPYGVLESGCPRTTCAPNPCANRTCGRGNTCITRPSGCRFRNSCPHEAACVVRECRDVAINVKCDFGFTISGCPRPTCAPNPCQNTPCPSGQRCFVEPGPCDYGLECPYVRKCIDRDCAEVLSISCPFGILESGCPRGTCAPNPCDTTNCGAGRRCISKPFQCKFGINCPYVAECVQTDCADVLANKQCNFGFLAEGCPRPSCAPNPCEGNPCQTGKICFAEPGNCTFNSECPFVRKCVAKDCREVLPLSCGFGILETGCPRATCSPDPCLVRNCGPGQLCTTRPSQCRFEINCPHEAVCSAADCARVSDVNCPFGVMETGCPRSVCAANPCLASTCGLGRTCSTRPSKCTYGTNCPHEAVCSVQDCAEVSGLSCPYGVLETGCPRSTCAPNPCLGRNCGADRRCTTRPSDCRFRNNCPHEAVCEVGDCREVSGNLKCQFGFSLSGCPRATCAPNPCQNTRCPSSQRCFVEPGQCAYNLECPYIRKCVDRDCSEVLPLQCPFGILEAGCPRDTCASNPCNSTSCGTGRRCTSQPSQCGFGNNCPHVAECVQTDCADVLPLACSFGILENGCPRDTCSPDPCASRNCGQGKECITRASRCGSGTECPHESVCVESVCPEVAANIQCAFGFESEGCPRSMCAPNPCDTANCLPSQICVAEPGSCLMGTNCPYTARCQERDCEEVLDNIKCDFGVLLNGCPRGTCAPNPCEGFTCTTGQTCFAQPAECAVGIQCPYARKCVENSCEEVVNMCCPYGFLSEGCPRRTCAPNPCLYNHRQASRLSQHSNQCSFKARRSQHSNQCSFTARRTLECAVGQTCYAKPSTCEFQNNCSFVTECKADVCEETLPLSCEFGFKNIGCPRRECADNPCKPNSCPLRQRCFAKPGSCQFRTNCPYEVECKVEVCAETLPLFCEFGFKNIGCPRKECADNPCNNRGCPSGQSCYAKSGTCEFGENCPYEATCILDVCEETLPLSCEFGFKSVGCPRRECAENPCVSRTCGRGQSCFTKPGICGFRQNCPYIAECRDDVCANTIQVSCDFGFQSVGCPRRVCADDPCRNTTCPRGQQCYAKGSTCEFADNCPFQAECKPNVCAETLPMSCEFGFKNIGCPRNECADNPCAGFTCPTGRSCFTKPGNCPFQNNCPYEADCKLDVCEETLQVSCQFGFKNVGCPRRECADSPCDNIACPSGQTCYAKTGQCQFLNQCPFEAECKVDVCEETMPLPCEFGFKSVGCPRRECADNPCSLTSCSGDLLCFARQLDCEFKSECSYVADCRPSVCAETLAMNCPFGFLENDCPRKACAPDPCLTRTCIDGQVCTSQPSQCLYRNECPHLAACVDINCRDVLPNLRCEFGVLLTGCPRDRCAPNPCESNPCPPGQSCFVEPGDCAFGIECPFVRRCAANDCPRALPISCPFGLLEIGCPRSTCAPDPCSASSCNPSQFCASLPSQCQSQVDCPYEVVCLDRDCPRTMSGKKCDFGFAENGCPRELCAADPCISLSCGIEQTCVTRPSQCQFGSYCPHEAFCEDTVCEQVASNVRCTFGVEIDGCPRVQCSPNPCANASCEPGQSCAAVPGNCTMKTNCPYTYTCLENDCLDVMPNIRCVFGVLEEGCPRSQCAPNPCFGLPCPVTQNCFAVPGECTSGVECPYVSRCITNDCPDVALVSCSYGILESGCPRSTCAPDPCTTRDCGPAQVCISRPSQCSSNISCPYQSECVAADCREVIANVRCDYGFQLSGCPRSTCAPNPCELPCPRGQKCFAEPGQCDYGLECPYVRICNYENCAEMLQISCQYGVLETGCPRETCAPNPCATRDCGAGRSCRTRPTACPSRVECPHEAECVQSVCREVASNVQCSFGFQSAGCPRSQCAPNPCERTNCSAGQTCFAESGNCELGVNCPYQASCTSTDCGDIVPNLSCTFGVLLDGCPRRSCAPNPCDGRNCPIGQRCVTEPGDCVYQVQCPFVSRCVDEDCADVLPLNCPFGVWEKGCPRDTCAPNPCLTTSCGANRICITRPSRCLYGNKCPHEAICTDSVCSAVAANVVCPFGFLSEGCPRFQCSPNPCQNITCGPSEECMAEAGSCPFDSNCPFVHKCGAISCEATVRVFCPYGFESTGCPRQICAADPCLTTTCKSDELCYPKPGLCEFNSNCPFQAECRPSVCGDMMPISCPFGFKSIGCPRSECAADPCRSNVCGETSLCYVKNGTCEFKDGCPMTSDCRASVCEEILPMDCPMGFKLTGCPRAKCAEDPCLVNNCSVSQECFLRRSTCGFNTGCPMESFCRERVCDQTLNMDCPYGFEAVGCPRSVCSPDPCVTVRCGKNEVCSTRPRQCEFQSGCPHEAYCSLNLCERVCSKNCPFGYKLEGCPRCECSPDPCLGNPCSAGLTCKTKTSACEFNTGCPHEAVCDNSACEATCNKQCDYGFKSTGCPRCDCSPDPCMKTRCPVGQVCRPKVQSCEFSTGCPAVAACEDFLCSATCNSKQCNFGYQMTGCPRCTCSKDPCIDQVCPSGATCVSEPGTCVLNNQCPYHAVCKNAQCTETCGFRTCTFGYLESGCPRCNCAPNPCVAYTCETGERCIAVEGTCLSNVACPQRPVCVAEAVGDICILPRQRGTCAESISSYYYDAALKTCKWFSYSGCSGNANRFETWFQCMQTCNKMGATVGR